MKTILCLLALGLAANAKAAPIIDFSEDNSSQYSDKIYEFEKKDILSQLYGDAYSLDWDQCKGEETLIESEIRASKGSYTSPGANEIILTFYTNTCPGSTAGRHSTIVLVRDGKVVSARDDLFAGRIDKVFDIDGDGASEAIVSFSGGNQGYFADAATTLSFAGGRIKELDYISGVVSKTSCGALEDQGEEIAAVFFPSSAGKPLQKNYSKSCREGSAYKFHSDGPLEGI